VSNKTDNRTKALAGIFQAACCVRDIAMQGHCDPDAYLACIKSVFTLDAPSVNAVYGEVENLSVGLEALVKIFDAEKRQKSDVDISHYLISLLILERKLSKNKHVLQRLRGRIEFASTQADYFHDTHPTVIANLADTYLHTLSKFAFRIRINGRPEHLKVGENLEKIRALLLAGIRSAVLWRQLGGSRTQLIFSRTSMVKAARDMLECEVV